MASNAVDKVFNTPELLEAILIDLDIKTILLSQRVNRTFNATIAGSIKLRRKLYFEPATAADSPGSWTGLTFEDICGAEQILAPEGYRLRITQNPVGRWTAFEFDGKIPTSKTPTTGSWREMRAWPAGKKYVGVGVFLDERRQEQNRQICFASVPPYLKEATFGELLDHVVERCEDQKAWK